MYPELELQIAADLLFGTSLEADLGLVNIRKLVRLLQRNRVPLAVLQKNSTLEALLQDAEFAEFASTERERFREAQAAYAQVHDSWRKEGIDAVLVKSPGYFPYTNDNLDVLIHHRQTEEATRVLKQLGYIELPHVREPHKYLFRKVEGPYFTFPIHLHTRVAWINTFLTGEEVMRSSRESRSTPGVAFPSAEHILLITTAHWLYEDKELKLRDLYHVTLALEDDIDWEQVWTVSERRGWDDGLRFGLFMYSLAGNWLSVTALTSQLPDTEQPGARLWSSLYSRRLQRQQPTLPFKLPKLLFKGLHFKKTVRDRHLTPQVKLAEFSLLVLFMVRVKIRRILRYRYLLVAISGPDGSGKTTLAKALRTALVLFGLPATYHWLRVAYSKSLEIIKMPFDLLVRSARQNTSPKPVPQQGPPPRKHFLERHPQLRNWWGYLLALDFLVRLWARLFWAATVGGIHIFDRYAVDAALELAAVYSFPAARLVVTLAPEPDLSILLWVDQEEAIRRSATHLPTEQRERILPLYRADENQFDLTFSEKETPEQSLSTVTRAILERYLRARS